jgi:hypothetical protein
MLYSFTSLLIFEVWCTSLRAYLLLIRIVDLYLFPGGHEEVYEAGRLLYGILAEYQRKQHPLLVITSSLIGLALTRLLVFELQLRLEEHHILV